jgi:hypothetical protein
MVEVKYNLLELFRAKGIADEELPMFLNAHFRSAGHSLETNEVFYPKSKTPVLALVYKHGRLQEVRSEMNLPLGTIEELCETIYRNYVGNVGTGFCQEVLFCRQLTVKAAWRYRDLFQILPIPSTAPRPPFSYAEHPFLLEYSFPATGNGHTSGERRVRELRRLELLLGCLLTARLRSDNFRSAESSHRWVTDYRSYHDGPSCAYQQLGYYWKDLKPHLESFSNIDEFPTIQSIPVSKYYVHFLPLSDELTIPDDLAESLDSFFALDADNQQRFLQACFWFSQADQAMSASASFINLIQAVETLMPRAKTEGRCRSCRKELKLGPTRLFKDFMDEYAPMSPSNNEMRQQLYRIRSGLAHGDAAPFMRDMGLDDSLNPLAIKELEYLMGARQAVRISMRNWLNRARSKVSDKPSSGHEYFSTMAFSGERTVVSGDEVRTLRNLAEKV